jgi:two-component system nitrate/nitrite response regulator NarL
MNSHHHLYLHSPPAPMPARWQAAFADGSVVDFAAMNDWLKSHSAAHNLIWLCTNPDWQAQLQTILTAQPDARVVVLSNTPQTQEGLVALNAGARGYTHAQAVAAVLHEVALVIEHGGLWVGPELMQRLVTATSQALRRPTNPAKAAKHAVGQAAALSALSGREAEVARAVASGLSNKEVADSLHISERTVKAHLGSSFEKLGVRDRLQLTLLLSGQSPNGALS